MSLLNVDKLDPNSGTALEIGTSGDTVTVPSGVGLTLTDSTLLLPTTINTDKIDPKSGTALEIGTSGDTITVPTGAGLTVTDEVKTNKISPATGTAFALGDSGDTFTVPSGATIANLGTATGFGGDNTPAFKAYIGVGQIIPTATLTKVTFQTELYDTDGDYDNSVNYRFTPQTAGKYFLLSKIRYEAASYTNLEIRIIKNGNTSDYAPPNAIFGTTSTTYYSTYTLSGALEANGSSDYFEVYSAQNSGGDASISASFGSTFEAFKLIT
tara:strand:- start:210 stop:1016 length:807 start_codon:yes stop_codon:yes gene_type:complete